eukprot:Platyproteum_vivax@DN6988_c0_g1_i2.p1
MNNKELYFEDINEEYEEVVEMYYASKEDEKFLKVERARHHKIVIDWCKEPPRVVPAAALKVTHLMDFDVREVTKYIDWIPFFYVYQLRGKFPNKDYPQLFNDPKAGETAKQLFEEAKELLEKGIVNKWFQCTASMGVFPANTHGDDITVYEDDDRKVVKGVFHGLRQQVDHDQGHYPCLSDFIAPPGHKDYLGMFACTAGAVPQIDVFKKKHEVDHAIMLEALADRLAEAFAELIHEKMRKEMWGIEEKLSLQDLLKVRYSGIRPAPGYPTQPDHREKELMWKLLDADKVLMSLTDSFMMAPAASVCAHVFAHPKAEYFAVGNITKDQVDDYSARLGETDVAETEKWLASNLGYERKR